MTVFNEVVVIFDESRQAMASRTEKGDYNFSPNERLSKSLYNEYLSDDEPFDLSAIFPRWWRG